MYEHIFTFLSKLVANNNREWFQQHRDEYEAAWGSFQEIVEELIGEIQKFDPSVGYLTPKDCTYHIYRDLRFSLDKTPYKGHFGAFVNADGKKAYYGGYYLQIEPHQCMLASGVWWLPSKEMQALRHAIADQMDIYHDIVENPAFKKLCPTIGLEHLKRIPNGFPKDFPHPEYLLCKDYTCYCTIKPADLSRKDGIKRIGEKFHIMQPFNEFLKENILINIEEMESMKGVVKFV